MRPASGVRLPASGIEYEKAGKKPLSSGYRLQTPELEARWPKPEACTMTIRRMKSYTGEQGYVYQYYFVGRRPAPNSPATEYIFDVTADRKTTFAVSVFIPQEALTAWAEAHDRPLTDAEQYAAAKMRLFQAFDEIENMMAQGRELSIDPANLEQLLTTLGVE